MDRTEATPPTRSAPEATKIIQRDGILIRPVKEGEETIGHEYYVRVQAKGGEAEILKLYKPGELASKDGNSMIRQIYREAMALQQYVGSIDHATYERNFTEIGTKIQVESMYRWMQNEQYSLAFLRPGEKEWQIATERYSVTMGRWVVGSENLINRKGRRFTFAGDKSGTSEGMVAAAEVSFPKFLADGARKVHNAFVDDDDKIRTRKERIGSGFNFWDTQYDNETDGAVDVAYAQELRWLLEGSSGDAQAESRRVAGMQPYGVHLREERKAEFEQATHRDIGLFAGEISDLLASATTPDELRAVMQRAMGSQPTADQFERLRTIHGQLQPALNQVATRMEEFTQRITVVRAAVGRLHAEEALHAAAKRDGMGKAAIDQRRELEAELAYLTTARKKLATRTSTLFYYVDEHLFQGRPAPDVGTIIASLSEEQIPMMTYDSTPFQYWQAVDKMKASRYELNQGRWERKAHALRQAARREDPGVRLFSYTHVQHTRRRLAATT